MTAVKAGLVQPQGTAHSHVVSQLRKEVSLLYRIFSDAKNYLTFLKTAAWARLRVNEAQFVKVCRNYVNRNSLEHQIGLNSISDFVYILR